MKIRGKRDTRARRLAPGTAQRSHCHGKPSALHTLPPCVHLGRCDTCWRYWSTTGRGRCRDLCCLTAFSFFFFFFFIFSHHSFFAAKIKHMNVQSDPRLRLDQLTPLACGVTGSAVLSEANDVKCKMTSNANVTKIKTSNSRTDEVSPDLRPLVRRLYPSSSHTRAPLTSKGAVVNLK